MTRKMKQTNNRSVLILKGNGGRKGRKNGRKARIAQGVQGLRGITQNVAVSVNTPFGDNPKPATLAAGLDAFNPCSVPLPRAIGDYTTIRTTQVIKSAKKLNLFGSVADSRTSEPKWSSICSQSGGGTDIIDGTFTTQLEAFDSMGPASWDYARMVPAAFSVQIMNPNALQTTSGIVYAGRARQMISLANKTTTWDALANELVSFSNPRLMSAGKLALKGVQIDAVPFDMNSLSDFKTRFGSSAGPYTNNDAAIRFDGFAPIYVYNPEAIELQYLVCCEWRVRFDPSNPAYAANTYHQPSSLGYWDALQRAASYAGNGVYDIAERAAAQHGPAVGAALMEYASTRSGLRGMRALGV